MDALDTSPQLAELRARVEHLLDRVASNSRITPAGLGTLDATEVPSGYAFEDRARTAGPALVGVMRLARSRAGWHASRLRHHAHPRPQSRLSGWASPQQNVIAVAGMGRRLFPIAKTINKSMSSILDLPDHLPSRVVAAFRLFGLGGASLGALARGVVANHSGARLTLEAALVLGLAAVALRPWR